MNANITTTPISLRRPRPSLTGHDGVESRISGRVSALGDDIVITETIGHRNFGTLTQINRGEDFPAAFALKRLVRFDTPIGVMYNEEPVDLRATLTSVPLWSVPMPREGVVRGHLGLTIPAHLTRRLPMRDWAGQSRRRSRTPTATG